MAETEPKKESRHTTPLRQSEVERGLAKIWADVLERDEVDADINFFDLGGDSVAAARVLSRMREAFDVELPLRTLFENPTVSGLALHIRKAQTGYLAKKPDDVLTVLHEVESIAEDEATQALADAPTNSRTPTC
jgi:acyl carrier protein